MQNRNPISYNFAGVKEIVSILLYYRNKQYILIVFSTMTNPSLL